MTANVRHLSVCPLDCPDTCGLIVNIEQGRVVSLAGNPAHPYTQGYICGKMRRYPEKIYSPGRIMTPLRRTGPKGSGTFEPISWDDALDEIHDRFQAIIDRYGAEAILPYSYSGTMGLIQRNAGHPFFYKLGASRLDRTICSSTAEAGWDYAAGRGISHDPEGMADSDLILLWGINAASTNLHILPFVKAARSKGAPLIVIDPYRNRTAKMADRHLMLKPGTDTALALGIMHLLIAEGWIDRNYIDGMTLGFDALRDQVRDFPPRRTAKITGLTETEIRDLAQSYGEADAPFIRLGMGMSRQRGGGMAIRSVACLPALTGAFAKRGGGITLMTGSYFELDMEAVQGEALLAGRTPRTFNMIHLGRILTEPQGPPVKGLFIYHSNPAATAPRQGKVMEGLRREDLFTIVHEQVRTDTVDYADLVLPATTFLEHTDLYKSYGHCYLQYAASALPPVGESKSNRELFRLLADRFGFTDPFFSRTTDEIIEELIAPPSSFRNGINLALLKEKGFARLNVDRGGNPFENGFFTPSGKFEFYSESMKKSGLPPLPDYRPPEPEERTRYPLILITPPAHHFLNSTFSGIESIRILEKEPSLWIHPDDAEARGIHNGDPIRLFNDEGECSLPARVTGETGRGVVVAESVWWPKSMQDNIGINALVSDEEADMGGGPAFHYSPVEVIRQ
ncbi:MAG: molybdopterin oxidoreductase family protein [Deltaproteobacteria bacterium]|nr:molybdopterin oxidoreductase family protein [Deltaproteobacteria bacterium]